jgi:hypothetical protein
MVPSHLGKEKLVKGDANGVLTRHTIRQDIEAGESFD